MIADVHLLQVEVTAAALVGPEILPGLPALVARVAGTGAPRRGPWAVKTHFGPPQRPPAVAPAWVADVAAALPPGAGDAFCCDTLSITTAPLDTVAGHTEVAVAKGYVAGAGLPAYRVADDPELGPSPMVGDVGLATAAAMAGGLAVLTPVRPHPHLGFMGALASLGLGLVDRPTKLALHRGIRPRVDTPLCAGCGSCLAVCLFDAIVIRGGRAWIDREACTGCGECMNACFMAGIAPEDAAGVPRFQARVAEAAAAVLPGAAGDPRPAVHLNFLVRLDRSVSGPSRQRQQLGDVGVLASRDPVALDRATWDVIAEGGDGSLQGWSGFREEPAALQARAEELGLGTTAYRLTVHEPRARR